MCICSKHLFLKATRKLFSSTYIRLSFFFSWENDLCTLEILRCPCFSSFAKEWRNAGQILVSHALFPNFKCCFTSRIFFLSENGTCEMHLFQCTITNTILNIWCWNLNLASVQTMAQRMLRHGHEKSCAEDLSAQL